jgi:hypothetical protein
VKGSRKCPVMFAALGLAALLSGCGALTGQPLPAAPLADAERARFDGMWMGDRADEAFTVHVTCDGVGHIATVGWDKGRFRMEQAEMVFSQGKKGGDRSRFVSVRVSELDRKPADKPMYVLLKYQFHNDDTLVFWGADLAAFAAAIQSGRLQGETGQYDNLITSPPQAVLDFIDDPADVRLFDYRDPMVWRKVAAASADTRESCAKK